MHLIHCYVHSLQILEPVYILQALNTGACINQLWLCAERLIYSAGQHRKLLAKTNVKGGGGGGGGDDFFKQQLLLQSCLTIMGGGGWGGCGWRGG